MKYSIFKTTASSIEEMQNKTADNYNFLPTVDATRAYKAAAKKSDQIFNFDEFCEKQLCEKGVSTGLGAYVVLDAPIKDKKDCPAKMVKKKKDGRGIKNKAFEIYDPVTLQVYKTIKTTISNGIKRFPTRAVAFKEARDVVTNLKTTVAIREISISDDPDIGCVEYVPSKGTKDGSFVVFGIPSPVLVNHRV